MLNSEKNRFLLETEVKPNRYAKLVMVFLVFGMVTCWLMTEIGLFRVGKWEMRIGTFFPLIMLFGLLVLMDTKKEIMESPKTKWYVFAVTSILTLCINTLLTFHTTMMLLFPIFIAMLYRSKKLGIASVISSSVSTVLSPILGYLFHLWDIPLLQELILIGQNVTVSLEGATNEITLISVLKILLYLVFPRLIMVGSCAFLMFHVIRVGVDNVNKQLLLDRINRRDTLTGLYNQNYFKQLLRTEREELPIGLLFFDVNGLKQTNDTFGHEYGDILLKNCAKSLTDVCDDDTYGFRVGGDEFLLLMENADEEKMNRKITQWRAALDEINESISAQYPDLHCSLACGHVVGSFADIDELLRRVDTLMYRNKEEMKQKP